MHDGRYTHSLIVVAEIYKGYVVGTAWYVESLTQPIKLRAVQYTGVWVLSDLHFEDVREFHTYPTMSALQLKRTKFLIDIKKLPHSVWYMLPPAERAAIDQLAKECAP